MTAIFARIMMTFNWLCPLGSLFFVTKHGPHGRYWDREWCHTARPPDKLTCAYVAVRMRVERIRRTWCVFISQNKISGKGRMGGREDGWREREINRFCGRQWTWQCGCEQPGQVNTVLAHCLLWLCSSCGNCCARRLTHPTHLPRCWSD